MARTGRGGQNIHTWPLRPLLERLTLMAFRDYEREDGNTRHSKKSVCNMVVW